MQHGWQKVSLANISVGAAVERFDEALAEVIQNIMDVNTEAKKLREIKLSVKILPDEDRNQVQYSINVDKKLAAPRSVKSIMYVGHQEGELVALEQDVKQEDLPFENGPEIVKFKKEAGNDR